MHPMTAITILASLLFLTVHANNVEARASNCLPKALSILAPLSTEPAVLSYCSSHFPVPPVTVTKTITGVVQKRAATTAVPAKNSNYENIKADKLSTLLSKASSLIGSVCICFEGTQTITTTVTRPPNGQNACNNYFVCDNGKPPARCGKSAKAKDDDCLCLKRYPDGGGICVFGDHPCIACASDADCNGDVCVQDTCCGLPVCTPAKNPSCSNKASPRRLFERERISSASRDLKEAGLKRNQAIPVGYGCFVGKKCDE